MSQKKRTAHERGAELVRSGAWASGRRWADDAPGALLEQDCVQLCPGGAAGAFVHGLEDELMGKCQVIRENPSELRGVQIKTQKDTCGTHRSLGIVENVHFKIYANLSLLHHIHKL